MKTAKNQGFQRDGLLSKINPKSILSIICALAMLFFMILFFANHVVALILAMGVVPPNLDFYKIFYIFIPSPVPVFGLDGTELFLYFLFIVTCIFLSITWMFVRDFKRAITWIIDALKLKPSLKFKSKNSIFLVGQLCLAYYFFYAIYWGSLDLLGIFSIGEGPNKVDHYDMFILANSPVYEEVIFRFGMIGIPLLIFTVLLVKSRKKWAPIYRYIIGGKLKLGPLALLFTILSSIIFAVGHIYSYGSPYIFPPIFLLSLMFSYLFLRKGIHTAIILHFSVTYMDMLIFANHSGYINGFWYFFLGVTIVTRYLLIAIGVIAGPFFFYLYSKSGLSFTIKTIKNIAKIG